jgi:hypothetical protein
MPIRQNFAQKLSGHFGFVIFLMDSHHSPEPVKGVEMSNPSRTIFSKRIPAATLQKYEPMIFNFHCISSKQLPAHQMGTSIIEFICTFRPNFDISSLQAAI